MSFVYDIVPVDGGVTLALVSDDASAHLEDVTSKLNSYHDDDLKSFKSYMELYRYRLNRGGN